MLLLSVAACTRVVASEVDSDTISTTDRHMDTSHSTLYTLHLYSPYRRIWPSVSPREFLLTHLYAP